MRRIDRVIASRKSLVCDVLFLKTGDSRFRALGRGFWCVFGVLVVLVLTCAFLAFSSVLSLSLFCFSIFSPCLIRSVV